MSIHTNGLLFVRIASARGPVERAMLYPAAGTALGCWFGAIPLALDWDRPWQVRWGRSTPASRPNIDAHPVVTGLAAHTHVRRCFGLYRGFNLGTRQRLTRACCRRTHVGPTRPRS